MTIVVHQQLKCHDFSIAAIEDFLYITVDSMKAFVSNDFGRPSFTFLFYILHSVPISHFNYIHFHQRIWYPRFFITFFNTVQGEGSFLLSSSRFPTCLHPEDILCLTVLFHASHHALNINSILWKTDCRRTIKHGQGWRLGFKTHCWTSTGLLYFMEHLKVAFEVQKVCKNLGRAW